MNNLESYNSARREGLKNTNILVWTRIPQVIPPELRTLEVNVNELVSLEFQCREMVFHPLTSRSKHFYELLILKLRSREALLSGRRNFAWMM